VSRRLGYREDGSRTAVVRGRPRQEIRLLLHRAGLPGTAAVDAEVSGLDACRELLGAG